MDIIKLTAAKCQFIIESNVELLKQRTIQQDAYISFHSIHWTCLLDVDRPQLTSFLSFLSSSAHVTLSQCLVQVSSFSGLSWMK